MVDEILVSLAARRPVFHSEVDFQHEFALELKGRGFEVRLERPYDTFLINWNEDRQYLDCWARKNKKYYAFEFKYKTRAWEGDCNCNGASERFHLLDQGAYQNSRYDFWKDVARLEKVVMQRPEYEGYVIFLTNASAYLNDSGMDGTHDEQFRIYRGRTVQQGDMPLTGELAGRRSEPIALNGCPYELNWKVYSKVYSEHGDKDLVFEYLCLKINNPG